MIELVHIRAAYPGKERPVLDGLSLKVSANRTTVLLGASGSGKSSLLRAIMGLLPLREGTIRLDGEDIAGLDPVALRRRIGMVFQHMALFPHLNVRQNIALNLKLAHWPKADIAARVDAMLALVGLPSERFGERYPHQLSGGEQQRVGVARALAPEPAYLLMDEPFGALDAITRRALQEELKTLRATLNVTILMVTHDVTEAVMLGDELAVLNDGRVEQQGAAQQLLRHPASPVVEQLLARPLRSLLDIARGEAA